ncbi:apolipoprotein N-acyltransferase [Polynucleobacter sp. UK-Mo-2m-Kol15]|uniref:apolipoprotein N-acyltransferase n=1 Tax=Polynucleobacter sp. UK-Mo-2m-Kol15 TaxID=2576916 RepID=UPI001C0BF753|nr:apolipoprotein N-acyltransferase [Polynucleobacter sp. UK-Mo-2m-Kol15]MBU3574240.1 apolipoprotein N-acyltransferase [Polynucleobacter sp. UK-Mo-2m-Kol15]
MSDRQSVRLSNSVNILLLLFLGAILAAAAELPYGGWIQLPILSLIWWRMSQQSIPSIKNQFISGMSFALGYFILGLWWIYISLHDVGGMNPVLAGTAVFLLSAYVAAYFSLASLSLVFFKTSRLTGLLLAASWVGFEYFRGEIFTGFPWMGFAETQLNGPFAPVAPLFGGLACTFLVVWISWEITRLKKDIRFSGTCIIFTIALMQLASFWTFTKPIGEPISVRLIQGNFEQSLKLNPKAIEDQFNFYTSAIEHEPADLIITPETAYPWPQSNLPSGLINSLQQFSNKTSSNILLGVIGEAGKSDEIKYTNRALGLSPHLPAYQYDKSHLVPFGEFIPPGFHWFVNAFHVPMSDFARGKLDQAPFSIVRAGKDDIHAAITICYEDVFGGELASRIHHSSKPVNLLINMTNLAWFGDSQAPAQQLRLSQLRSLETGLPALRATNTGITAALGPNGKVLSQLAEFKQGVLSLKIQAYSGTTPYVIWGNAPILSLSCLLLVLGLIRQRRI